VRQAPFVAWIHDLSAPDNAVRGGRLPIRCCHRDGGLGFMTQKLTPTDPRQASTMI